MPVTLYELKQIDTPRLLIRPVQLGDEVLLHESIERSLPALERWMPWARGTNFEATKDFIHRGFSHWQSRTSRDFPLLVIHKESQKVISASGFNEHSNLDKPCLEIGYWLDSTFVGQGLATELVNALTRFSLQALNAIRVQICIQTQNKKSLAVAERCGYLYEATLHRICLDCINRLPADGALFSCCDITVLPPLEVEWQWNRNACIKTNDDSMQERPRQFELSPILQTKRCILQAPRLQDAAKLFYTITQSRHDVGPWYPWVNSSFTQKEVHHYIETTLKENQNILGSPRFSFLVWDKTQKNILGEIWIKNVDWAVPNMQIGCWFDFRQIGNHDVGDVISIVVDIAFNKRRAQCIQCYVPDTQDRLLKIIRRLGFKKEGKLQRYFKDYSTENIIDADTFSMLDRSQLKQNL